MNIGKRKYTEIRVPDTIDDVIYDAVKRSNRVQHKKAMQHWLTSVAAVFVLLFIGANIMPVYAFACDLPVVGSIVRVLHIGSGGERTDGAQATAEGDHNTVEISFQNPAQEMNAAPVYTVTHALAPNRMNLTLHGVRNVDREALEKNLLETDAVRDVYPAMIGDDSMYGFIIILNADYDYEITEYSNPASLSLHFFKSDIPSKTETVYYLRSDAVAYGEPLGLLCEQFYTDGATQLKLQNGQYIITIGSYATEEEATAALQSLEAKYGADTGLFVTAGVADEIPEE